MNLGIKILLWGLIAVSEIFASWRFYELLEEREHAGVVASMIGTSLVLTAISAFSLIIRPEKGFLYTLLPLGLLVLILNIRLFEGLERGDE